MRVWHCGHSFAIIMTLSIQLLQRTWWPQGLILAACRLAQLTQYPASVISDCPSSITCWDSCSISTPFLLFTHLTTNIVPTATTMTTPITIPAIPPSLIIGCCGFGLGFAGSSTGSLAGNIATDNLQSQAMEYVKMVSRSPISQHITLVGTEATELNIQAKLQCMRVGLGKSAEVGVMVPTEQFRQFREYQLLEINRMLQERYQAVPGEQSNQQVTVPGEGIEQFVRLELGSDCQPSRYITNWQLVEFQREFIGKVWVAEVKFTRIDWKASGLSSKKTTPTDSDVIELFQSPEKVAVASHPVRILFKLGWINPLKSCTTAI